MKRIICCHFCVLFYVKEPSCRLHDGSKVSRARSYVEFHLRHSESLQGHFLRRPSGSIRHPISDIVRFIYDDDRCLPFFENEAVDLILYDYIGLQKYYNYVLQELWKSKRRRDQTYWLTWRKYKNILKIHPLEYPRIYLKSAY